VQSAKSWSSVLKCVTKLSLLRHSQHSFESSAENKMENLPLGLKYSNVLHLRISATKKKKKPVITTSVKAYLAYCGRYSVVPINSSLLSITLQSLVRTAVDYNDTNYRFMTL